MKLIEYNQNEDWKKIACKVYKIIELAESIDPNVGGPIYVGVIKDNNEVEMLDGETIEKMCEHGEENHNHDGLQDEVIGLF